MQTLSRKLRDFKGRITIKASVLPLPVNGMWFSGTNLQNMWHGWNEPATAQFIKRILRPGDTFVDIGANYGFYSVLAGKCGATVIAYEPDDTSFARLQRNLRLNRVRAELHKAAASDHDGTIEFYIAGKGAGTNSTRAAVIEGNPVKTTVPAERCTARYDLCKLDVEGAELSVLRGMTHHGTIVCELNPSAHERQGSSPQAFLDGIRSLGWQVEDIEEGPKTEDYLIAKAREHSVLNILLKP